MKPEVKQRLVLYRRLHDLALESELPGFVDIAEQLVRGALFEQRPAHRASSVHLIRLRRLARSVRARWRALRAVPPDFARSDVLVVFPFNRADHVSLIAPSLRILADDFGMKASVFCHAGLTGVWDEAVGRHGANVYSLEELHAVSGTLPEARLERGMRAEISRVLQPLRPSPGAVAHASDVYAAYWQDRAVMTKAVRAVAPRTILGLHFVNNPGYLAAAKHLDPPVPVALVQHGMFSRDAVFHDFAGADLLAAWSEHWRNELAAYPTLPGYDVPRAIVTGNPKLEYLIRATRERAKLQSDEPSTVLYLRDARPTESIDRLVARTAERLRGARIVVKPHPSKTGRAVVDALSQRGFDAASIADPRADTHELIRASRVVVGAGSTALFDAVAMGRIALSVRDPGQRTNEGHAASFETFDGCEALGDRLNLLLNDSAVHAEAFRRLASAVAPVIGPTAGAAQRIASLTVNA